MRVLILQHPRERKMSIGTARMAHLALPQSLLRVGIEFAADPIVTATLHGSTQKYLLFPGPTALDLKQVTYPRDLTLIVLDGTWSQARTLLRVNPALASLPRIGFTPSQPSDYRIRRQPADFCVSTIEALAETLSLLEPEGGDFKRILQPFRAMVDRQIWFKTEVRSSRHARRLRKPRPPERPSLSTRICAEWPRLVCIQGEANNWPIGDPERQEPATAHFVACRPSTGEIYESIIAPRRALAPSTAAHVDLAPSRLYAGCTVESWQSSWQKFVRPDDVLVQWGTFHADLAASEGLQLSPRRIELKREIAQLHGRRCGTVEECATRFGAAPSTLPLDGRAGLRLSALVSLVCKLGPTVPLA